MLAGQRLGIKEVDDDIWIVSFMHDDLGFIAISNRKPCNPSTTPSAQGCHPSLRYVSLPMSPVRTTDCSLEEDGFELAVPPRRERLWAATPGKHCRFGPEPVGGSAFRAAVSDWQRPDEPFAGAEPIVRIRSPSSAEAVPTARSNGWATKNIPSGRADPVHPDRHRLPCRAANEVNRRILLLKIPHCDVRRQQD